MGLHKTTKVYEAGFFLTQGQRNVLKNIALGLTNEEIMKKLNISRCAVNEHIKEINYKLGLEKENWSVKRLKSALWYWQNERGLKL